MNTVSKPSPLADEELLALAEGRHAHPHRILGPHRTAESDPWIVRVRRPLAAAVRIRTAAGAEHALAHEAHGIFSAVLDAEPCDYRILTDYDGGPSTELDDPYRFGPTLGELDLHLIAEGRHEQLWQALGARIMRHQGADGVAFSVWAPRARAVRLLGEFNGWEGSGHALRRLDGSDVWELFVPGLGEGALYKFEIGTADGRWLKKADPMARAAEQPPATASRVTESRYRWGDDAWMQRRAGTDPLTAPLSVYELHLGSWRPGLGYVEAADELIDYVQGLGYTHVEFLPLAEHPYGPSWGYQVSGYYAPTSRFGTPDELRHLVDRLHQAGIGVLLDWVPGHFPKDEFALAQFDGQPLYEHPDPRRGEHQDWGTLIFDYGRPQVRNFLVANALYWLEEFHFDGLRVDAVASMLYLDYSRAQGQWEPNRFGGRENLEAIGFLQEVNATAMKRSPGILMIAEESTSFPGVTAPTFDGGLGFSLKWNMGWMNDTLEYIQTDTIYRRHHHHGITHPYSYAFSERFLLPISHDEVVHGKGSLLGKMPGDAWQQAANLRAYLAFQWSHPGRKLLFMGQEFGQPGEWSEARGLDWQLLEQPLHRGISTLVGELNRCYREHPALWALDDDPACFQWLETQLADSAGVAFLRRDAAGSEVAVAVNFSVAPVTGLRLGLPRAGAWREVLNTDAIEFGGSGVGNLSRVLAEEVPWSGQPASAELTLPPLGALWLTPED